MAPNAGTILPFFGGLKLQKMKQNLITILLLMVLGFSCSEEPVETVFFDLDTREGVFISCEGNFMYGNGSLSFYNRTNQQATNRLFYARNNVPLGDVVQSLAVYNNSLFIVVNNSGKIYIADSETVEFRDVITGLTSPRYIHFVSDGKAYVSDLYATHLTLINPITFEKTGRVDLNGHTSEEMVRSGKYLFVTAWPEQSVVLVVDTETEQLVHAIDAPDQPKGLEKDKNGKLWVLSEGNYDDGGADEGPALSRIDPLTFTIEQIYRFPSSLRPSNLEMNPERDTLFFIYGGVQKMAVGSRHLPDIDFIPAGDRLFYSLAVDPSNGDIYVSDAIDYTQDAFVYRYSSNGTRVDSFRVGINPSGFGFR